MTKKRSARRRKQQAPPSIPAVTMATVQQARTAANKVAFLEQFKAAGTISAACRGAGIDRKTHYNWLQDDPAYVEAFEEAEHVRVELLETEGRRRALVGWEEPVYQGGKHVGSIRKFSDTLLIFLLKAERPEKYRERFETRIEGGSTPISFTLNIARPPQHLLDARDEPMTLSFEPPHGNGSEP